LKIGGYPHRRSLAKTLFYSDPSIILILGGFQNPRIKRAGKAPPLSPHFSGARNSSLPQEA
jgi:hypothetical protein